MARFNPSKDIPDQAGKVFFVTGGTAGLGQGTILNLAAHNPSHIYFTGRNETSANNLIRKIADLHPGVRVSYIKCDNANLVSVKDAATKFLSENDRLDVLFCNAGVMALEGQLTQNGYEIQFQTNHLAHALFIKLFTPILEKTAKENGGDARIINLSSDAYKQAPPEGVDFATVKTPQLKLGKLMNGGPKWARYGQSKLSNMLYPQQLIKHHPSITAVSIHPGIIKTDMLNGASRFTRWTVYVVQLGQITPVEQGAYNQLWAATTAKQNLKNGEYYEPVGIVGKRATKQARNMQLGKELWNWTQKELEQFS